MAESRKGLHPATVLVLILTVVFVTLNLSILATNVHQRVTVGGNPSDNRIFNPPTGGNYYGITCTGPEALLVRWFYQGEPLESEDSFRYYRVKGMDPADAMLLEFSGELIIVHPRPR